MMSLPKASWTSTSRFGREQVRVAVQMRAKQHAFLGDFAKVAEAEDLEAAGIGQDRARPRHELVQTAQFADQLVSGAQEQMIGIGQDDFGVEFAFQIALRNAFDRGLRAHRHEDRRLDDAVSGVQQPGARARVGALGLEFKMHYFTAPCRRRISRVLSIGSASTV